MGFSGNVHGPDPQMCDVIRVVVEESAAIAAQLDDNDKLFMAEHSFYKPYVCPLDVFA